MIYNIVTFAVAFLCRNWQAKFSRKNSTPPHYSAAVWGFCRPTSSAISMYCLLTMLALACLGLILSMPMRFFRAPYLLHAWASSWACSLFIVIPESCLDDFRAHHPRDLR